MSKAMLIIDMPNSCLECEILDHDELTCMGMKIKYGDLNTRQYFCPIKPLPYKKNKIKELPQYTKEYEAYCKGEVDGWNFCLDEILGEEE